MCVCCWVPLRCFVNKRVEFYAYVSIEAASKISYNWKSFIEFDRRLRFAWAKQSQQLLQGCMRGHMHMYLCMCAFKFSVAAEVAASAVENEA